MPFTLPASAGAASLTDLSTTEAQQKTNLTNLRGFIAEMLGTDSTSRDSARSLLGIDQPTLTFSVGSSAWTIALKTPAGADGTSAAPISMSFRSATLTSGALVVRKVTAAASLVISSGSTLGMTSGADSWLYIYALDNSGTVELAVSGTYHGDHFIGSTTAEGGAGGADSDSTIYSTTGRSSVAMRLLAAVRSNQTTAGTWAAVPVECRLAELGGIERTGKKWRTLTGSRAAATTYTNSTGQDLHISVVSGLSSSESLHLTVDGVIMQRNGSSTGGSQHSVTACIPPGSTYSITVVAGSIGSWFELR
jgi:hypothetical protein